MFRHLLKKGRKGNESARSEHNKDIKHEGTIQDTLTKLVKK